MQVFDKRTYLKSVFHLVFINSSKVSQNISPKRQYPNIKIYSTAEQSGPTKICDIISLFAKLNDKLKIFLRIKILNNNTKSSKSYLNIVKCINDTM